MRHEFGNTPSDFYLPFLVIEEKVLQARFSG